LCYPRQPRRENHHATAAECTAHVTPNQEAATKVSGSSVQYFGQNSGSHFGDGAVVAKLFVSGAGFFQAVPLGSMLRNALDQMLIEGAPLEACHGKR
jgi:hypothetical protein